MNGHLDVEAWLPDDHDLTDEQVEQLREVADRLGRRHPGDGNADERQIALTIAYRALRGDTAVIDELATDLADAQEAAWQATAGLRMAARFFVTPHGPLADGEYARRAGVNRATVRNWLNKG
jgi:hypothetical protein